MAEKQPITVVVLGLDIIKYSEKSMLDQKLAQERIDRCLNKAIKIESPEESLMPHWVDAGDGGYALFQWAAVDVLEALKRFYLLINRENNGLNDKENNRVLVRSAMHIGKVIVWDTEIGGKKVNKFTSPAINNCARLMAGMIKEHDRQVICSRPVLDDLFQMDNHVSPTRLKDIEDKHSHMHEVWNLFIHPTLGVKPIEKELFPDPFLRIYPTSH